MMRGTDIEVGRIYLAYCGSLAPVRVLETNVPFAFPGQVAPKRIGVRVAAVADVPRATDWAAALSQGRTPQLAYRQGDEFVMPSRDVERLAHLDIIAIDTVYLS
jgi:hypothetical protein